jgi:glutamate N-acetyltransferase/amino-acid N-acetyltransferase
MVRHVEGGLSAVAGMKASACRVGIKAEGLDLALVLCDPPAQAAGVFTTNRLHAAPVGVTKEHIAHGGACRAVLINSGNANAGTGPDGLEDARACAEAVAAELGCPSHEVLLMSTGLIGVRLPVEPILQAVPGLVAQASPDGGASAAEAICTTDTRPKTSAVEWLHDGRTVRLGGMAKGAGMIAPRMATMLAVVATDLAAGPEALQVALRAAVDRTFNRITVDGDMSTNDSVVLLATGASDAAPLEGPGPEADAFQAALDAVCGELARQIVLDGEGATRLAAITVAGAESEAQAVGVAQSVARSLLVKTALFGCDPNWGRVIAAVGASGEAVEPERLDITYGGVPIFRAGRPVEPVDEDAMRRAACEKEVPILIDLHLGPHEATVLTTDLSPEYVRFNAEYTT